MRSTGRREAAHLLEVALKRLEGACLEARAGVGWLLAFRLPERVGTRLGKRRRRRWRGLSAPWRKRCERTK
eukprot:scaffold53264_cov63-Phaeocystis_antarctica.AAC.1